MIWFGRKKDRKDETTESTRIEQEEHQYETKITNIYKEDTGKVLDITKELLRLVGINSEVRCEIKGNDCIAINVAEDESSNLLIEKDGSLLDAVEYIISKIINKDRVQEKIIIEMDINGFRQKRSANLEEMADELSSKVKKTSKAFVTKPLPPRDRKVIHMRLEGSKDVKTYSRGDGLYKRVVISLKD